LERGFRQTSTWATNVLRRNQSIVGKVRTTLIMLKEAGVSLSSKTIYTFSDGGLRSINNIKGLQKLATNLSTSRTNNKSMSVSKTSKIQ